MARTIQVTPNCWNQQQEESKVWQLITRQLMTSCTVKQTQWLLHGVERIMLHSSIRLQASRMISQLCRFPEKNSNSIP